MLEKERMYCNVGFSLSRLKTSAAVIFMTSAVLLMAGCNEENPETKVAAKVAKTKPPVMLQGLKLMSIPQGSYMMGDNQHSRGKPVHEVSFAKGFYMSQTEVTYAQYDAYADAKQIKKPSDNNWGRDNRPVTQVSWDDAQGYANWLSKQNTDGMSCRLPSEAEWEYAARAGTTTEYFWGDEIGHNNAVCNGCASQWDNKKTAPVASFKANAFGLYDMHGNAWEWTQDCFQDNYEGAPADGSSRQTKDCGDRVLRGGGWYYAPVYLRSAYRLNFPPGDKNPGIGFRVVCSLPSAGN